MTSMEGFYRHFCLEQVEGKSSGRGPERRGHKIRRFEELQLLQWSYRILIKLNAVYHMLENLNQ